MATKRLLGTALALFALALGTGCKITTRTINIGQKTALERQLMGELEPLSEEELLVASVRAAAGNRSQSIDELQSRALAARRRQAFNRDELQELKGQGCLGEALGAKLVSRACAGDTDPEVQSRRTRLLDEENADRAVVVEWVLASDESLAGDRAQVDAMYHRVLIERALAGEWIQRDGSWVQK